MASSKDGHKQHGVQQMAMMVVVWPAPTASPHGAPPSASARHHLSALAPMLRALRADAAATAPAVVAAVADGRELGAAELARVEVGSPCGGDEVGVRHHAAKPRYHSGIIGPPSNQAINSGVGPRVTIKTPKRPRCSAHDCNGC